MIFSHSELRLDRALSLKVFRQLGKLGTRPGIPILMYHNFGAATGATHPYYDTDISPGILKEHLEFLRTEGYTPVHLSQVLEMLRIPRETGKVVAITFDDGLRNFYTQAFPLLRSYDVPAMLFVPSGLVGKESSCLGTEPLMTWQEIREVSRHGIEIGSHSVSHANLYHAEWRNVEKEVRLSKAAIEDKTGKRVRSFAYPYAFPEQDKNFYRRLVGLLEQAGYEEGVSTIIGRARRNHSRFVLPRLPVNSRDDLALFAAKLDGYYDWLHLPQYAHKLTKTFSHSSGASATTEGPARA